MSFMLSIYEKTSVALIQFCPIAMINPRIGKTLTMLTIGYVIYDTDSPRHEKIEFLGTSRNAVVSIVGPMEIDFESQIAGSHDVPCCLITDLGRPVPMVRTVNDVDVFVPVVHLVIDIESVKLTATDDQITVVPVSRIILPKEIGEVNHNVKRSHSHYELVGREHIGQIFGGTGRRMSQLGGNLSRNPQAPLRGYCTTDLDASAR